MIICIDYPERWDYKIVENVVVVYKVGTVGKKVFSLRSGN